MDKTYGWGRKGRSWWHYWKEGHPRSVCSNVYHMGQIKDWRDAPPKGGKVCKLCAQHIGITPKE